MEQEHNTSTKDWLEYISKLNDRAQNRQRASGFTEWAIMCVIAILIVKALSRLPTITTNFHAAILHLTALAGVIDLLFFAVGFLMFLLSMGSESATMRLRSRLSQSSSPFRIVVVFAVFIAFAAVNLMTALVAPGVLHKWPFFTGGAVFLIIALWNPLSIARSWIKHKNHFRDLPELSTQPTRRG